jgi:heme/copper-type cytochrome/quinol oxidase subunit 2
MIRRRNFVTMILLSIITFGIYGIVFWYTYSDDMNTVCNGDGKETRNYFIVILLSIITCGIYYWFWLYSVGNRLSENAPRFGTNFSENGTTILLWTLIGSLLCGIGSLVAQYILVKNMNDLADRYNQQHFGGVQY